MPVETHFVDTDWFQGAVSESSERVISPPRHDTVIAQSPFDGWEMYKCPLALWLVGLNSMAVQEGASDHKPIEQSIDHVSSVPSRSALKLVGAHIV